MDTPANQSDRLQLGALGTALEREHREIDAGIDAFRAAVIGEGSAAASEAEADTEAAQAARAGLQRAIDALRRHIYLEEEFLFPPMEAELAIPIGVMLREHGEIWNTLDDLEARLAAAETPSSALAVCNQLAVQLDRHNAKEEPIFYSRADASLTPSESERLAAFLDSGQMPPGWVCEGAGP